MNFYQIILHITLRTTCLPPNELNNFAKQQTPRSSTVPHRKKPQQTKRLKVDDIVSSQNAYSPQPSCLWIFCHNVSYFILCFIAFYQKWYNRQQLKGSKNNRKKMSWLLISCITICLLALCPDIILLFFIKNYTWKLVSACIKAE